MNISDALNDLAACLCAVLTAPGYPDPKPCFCGVTPGEAVAVDMAADCTRGNGVAWVRLGTSYPSVTIGQQSQQTANCGIGLGFDVEVGVLREAEAWLEPQSLSAADTAAATERQIRDMQAMRKAISCCSELDPTDYILGQYRPMGPMGAYVGGTWTLYVGAT